MIKPNCISIICRYAVFLKRIVNNENQAILQYEKAISFFQNITSSKGLADNYNQAKQFSASIGRNVNETALFGENTAACIIMMSLQTEKVGIILHTNDAIHRVLGY